jgi:polyribonucleotide nucleotidyltransferase
MSSPAELLALKHAQAEALNSTTDQSSIPTPVSVSVSESPISSFINDSPTVITSATTDTSLNLDDDEDNDEEIIHVEQKRVVKMDDDKLFPALSDTANAPPVSWGPSSNGTSNNTWGKTKNNTFKQALKSTSTQVTFIIDSDQQQNLAKGEIFKIFAKIQSSLNVKVESTYSGATKKRTFLLNGPIDNVAIAKRELIRQLTKPTKISFEIPSKLRSTVIGSGGRTLKPIIDATSVRIDISKLSSSSSSSSNDNVDNDDSLLTENEELFGKSIIITIEGDIQGCSDAKAKILAIVNENTKNLSVKIPVSEKLKPFIKSEISKLSLIDGVEIITPELNSKNSFILITGPREAVIEIRNQIKTLLVNLDNQIVVDEREVPKHLHQFLDSDKVLSQSNVVIEVPSQDNTSSKVKFIGLKSNILNAIALAKELTSEYFVDNLDLSKSHGGNYQHAKNLTTFFIYTKYFEALSSEYGIKVSGPTYKNLADSNITNVIVTFIASKDKKEEIKKARKDLVDSVNKITPSFVKVITDIESFIFPKIDSSIAIENNVSIIPLGLLANTTNILLLVVQSADDEFLPSAEQIEEKLNNVNKSLDKLRLLNNELISEVIETSEEDQKHLEGNTLKVLLNKYEPNSIEIKLHQNAEGVSPNEIYLRGFKSEIKKAINEIKQLIEDVKNYEEASKYNTTIEFPSKFLARFIGQKGSHLNEIQDEFDVKIDVLTEDTDKVQNSEIKLTGLKSNVDECIKKINALSKKWADEKTVVVNIERKFRKQLIGPNGIYANRLQDKYNVKLQFSDSKEENGNVVIRGPSRGVAKVEEEIKQLLEYEKENGYVEFIKIPTEALARVIGKNGTNINDISDETSVKIYAKTNQEQAKELGSAEFELVGSRAGIKDAKSKIDAIVKRIVNSTVETIEVDPKWFRNLIGPNGMTMREIIVKAGGSEDDRDFRRFIQFPSRGSDSKTITCEGDKVVVGKIIESINKIVTDLESVTEETIEVPKKQHKLIIGFGGSVRRGIEEEFNVRVFVPKQDNDSDIIKIKGKAENIAKATAKIQTLTESKSKE